MTLEQLLVGSMLFVVVRLINTPQALVFLLYMIFLLIALQAVVNVRG